MKRKVYFFCSDIYIYIFLVYYENNIKKHQTTIRETTDRRRDSRVFDEGIGLFLFSLNICFQFPIVSWE